MSVREINSKFIGLRVQRQIPGEQKPRIQNFSFRIPFSNGRVTGWRDAYARERALMWKEAEALDLKWEKIQAKQKQLLKKEFDPFNGRTNTGIVGIRYVWATDSQGYVFEGFWINISLEGKTYAASVRLACRTWNEAWKIAVKKLAEIKDLDDKTVRKILRAMPAEEELRTRKPRPRKTA